MMARQRMTNLPAHGTRSTRRTGVAPLALSPSFFSLFVIILLAINLNTDGVNATAAGNGQSANLELPQRVQRAQRPWRTASRSQLEPRDVQWSKRAAAALPSPTAQRLTSPSGSPITCPADNLTVFTEPDSLRRYVIMCGRDYSSLGGTEDIGDDRASTMQACIALCAKTATCEAVGYGYHEGPNSCWLKRKIAQPNQASSLWAVAVEDPSQAGTAAEIIATKTPASSGSGGQLSGDAKAGIGVGVTVFAVLVGVGCVLLWYRRQQKRLRQRQQAMLERNKSLDTASSTGGGPSFYQSPSRGASYRSDARSEGSQGRGGGGGGGGVGPGGAQWPGNHLNSPNGSNSSSRSNSSNRSHSSNSNISRRDAHEGAGAAGSPLSENPAYTHRSHPRVPPPHLAHVARFMEQQENRRRQPHHLHPQSRPQSQSHAPSDTTTPPYHSSSSAIASPEKAVVVASSGWPLYANISNHDRSPGGGHEVSPWSGHPASELPVREGYQGYGPEYEMSAPAPGLVRALRPTHTPDHPPGGATPWSSREEQKFLASDVAALKLRVLKPDDRHELG